MIDVLLISLVQGVVRATRCYCSTGGTARAYMSRPDFRSVLPTILVCLLFSAQDVLRDNLERAVELLADTLINPRNTVEEVEEQKAVRT